MSVPQVLPTIHPQEGVKPLPLVLQVIPSIPPQGGVRQIPFALQEATGTRASDNAWLIPVIISV